MKLQHSFTPALIAAGSLILGFLTPPADAATRYVWQESPSPGPPYTNWSTAAHVIQEAVDVAQAGDTVLVTNGVYAVGAVVEGGETNRVALTNEIMLHSVNGPEFTLISGRGDTRCASVGADSVLSGFTLTNGTARSGGGVFGSGAYEQLGGTVTNCVLTGNSAGAGGGAFKVKLNNCSLENNSAYYGGGAYGGMLFDCKLIGNSGVEGGGCSQASVYNCILTGNSAILNGDGGGAEGGTLMNCLLTGNSAGTGGGARYATLVNCTVTGNSATQTGGGAVSSFVANSIIYFNSAPEGSNYLGGNIEFTCTTPLPAGPGNIDANPLLASTSHLSLGSPCIGAGDPGWADMQDIDGEWWAYPPSMGADEVIAGSITGAIRLSIHASHTNVAVGSPVDFRAHNKGRIAASVWDFGDGTRLTNRPFTSHVWTMPGTYMVGLIGFNESFPQGVSTEVQVTVLEQPVHYVNQANPSPAFPYVSWQTAATNFQDAVDAVTIPGSLVLVTNGLYDVGGGVSASRVALTNAVVLRSVNGPDVTVIQGAAAPDGGHGDGALRCAFVGTNAILSGFTLTNGHARSGGGVWCEPSGIVTNCVLTGNSAYGDGGGAAGGTLYNCTLTGNSASFGGGAYEATFEACTISGNSAYEGGGVFRGTLNNCTLTGNSASALGGGVAGGTLKACTLASNVAGAFHGVAGGGAYGATLDRCVVVNNYAPHEFAGGGGVAVSTLYNCVLSRNWAWSGGGSTDSTLYGCTLNGNSATFGGGASWSTLNNSTVTGNSADHGGGAHGGTLNNCTVTGNMATERGGGVFGTTLRNSIVYYNHATNGANYSTDDGYSIHLGYSCTTPLPQGEGNIDADPRFVNPATGDYRLLPDSPCVDTGTNLSAFLTTDLDGLPRPLDGDGDGVAQFDMGAYEFNPYRFAPTLQFSPDGFQFTVRGEPGKSVRIERSRDLVHWEFAGQVPIPPQRPNPDRSGSRLRTATLLPRDFHTLMRSYENQTLLTRIAGRAGPGL